MTIQANFPAIKPSLMLDFANTKQLDSRITYTRASTASYYDGVTTSKAEENLLTYSEQLDNAIWFKSNVTTSANATTAPDGTTTAEKIEESNTTSSYNSTYENYSFTSGAVYTASLYAKAGERNWIRFRVYDGTAAHESLFDLTNGVAGTTQTGLTSRSITSVGNGWYRLVITFTSSGTSGNFAPTIQDGDNGNAHTGVVGYGFYLWGAQLEQRSAVSAYTATTTQAITNYIPKLQSAASGVARFDNNPTTGESLGLLIEESRTNLVTYSSQFDNAAWNKTRATITADTVVAPDGTLTGDFITTNGTAGNKNIYVLSVTTPAANSTYTASIFAKNNGSSGLFQIELGNGANQAIGTFNLSTGAVGTFTVGGTVTACTGTITAVGNNWYRCAIVVTHGASWSGATNIAFYDLSAQTASTVTGMFLWGAQVELGSFATSYIPTVASQVTRAADAASMTGTNFSTWYNQGEGTIYADYSNQVTTVSINFGVLTIKDSGSDNAIGMLSGFSSGFTNFVPRVNATVQANLATSSSSPVNNKLAGSYAVDNFAAANNGTLLGTDTSGTIPVVDRMVIGSNRLINPAGQITIKKIAYYPLRVTNAQLQALTS